MLSDMLILPLLAWMLPAHAADVGLGLALGQPSGITLKAGLNDKLALDVLVGEMWDYDGWRHGDLFLSVDLLATPATITEGGAARLDFYIGGGVNVWVEGADFAVEMPLGLSLMFREVPVEVFLEAAPMVVLYYDPGFEGGGSLGARYYF